MSAGIIWINDCDPVADLGLTEIGFTELEGWSSDVAVERGHAALPNTPVNVVSPFATLPPSNLRITAQLRPTTIAARDTQLAKFFDLFSGLVEIRFGDAATKVLEGMLARQSVREKIPGWISSAVMATVDVVCHNPTKRDRYLQSAGFNASRTTIQMGTAPSVNGPTSPFRNRILIMGSASNPVVTMRDAAGIVVGSMTFTVALGTNEYLAVDLDAKTIKKFTAGVEADALSTHTSGDWLTLDNAYGSSLHSGWPTIECSGLTTGSCRLDYYRRWR